MTPMPQCNNEIYNELNEVSKTQEKFSQSAQGAKSKTASISSFYVTQLRELHNKEQKIKK